MTLNSTWSGSLFDLTVNPLFSGAIHWERVSWGPLPWNIRIKNPQLIDAGGIEVARFETFEVRDYNLFGLTEYTYGAQFVGLYNGHFNLHQRPHTDDSSQLIWNIEELFKPPHSIHKLDDGELVPPVLVQLNHCELEGIRGRVKMGTVDVSIFNGDVRGGFFEIDTITKVMRIRAEEIRVKQVNTEVFLRETTPLMTDLERAQAPIDKTLSYQHTYLQGEDFWWLGDAFGSQRLNTTSYQRDQLNLKSWVLDLTPDGVPHARGHIQAHLQAIERYIEPWGLDRFVRGEVKALGELNGPLDDPATRGLNLEGQLFVPQVGSLRFQVDGQKTRSSLVSLSRGRVWSQLGDLGLRGNFDLTRRLGTLYLKANELIWSSVTNLPSQWSRWEQSAFGDVAIKLRPHYDINSQNILVDRPFAIGAEVDLSASGPRRVHLKGRASLAADTLHLHQSLIEIHKPEDSLHTKPRQSIAAQGTLNLSQKTIDGHFKLRGDIKPNSLPPLKLPLQAKLDLQAQVSGSLSAPKLSGKLRALEVKSDMGGYPWRLTSLQSHFSFTDKILKLWKSEMKTRQGSARFKLHLPLHQPLQSTGWIQLKELYVDLSPLNILFSSSINGVVCTRDSNGCPSLIKRFPLSKSAARDSCIATLYGKESKPTISTLKPSKRATPSSMSQAETCLSLRKLKFFGVDFRELELNTSIRPKLIKIRRGRLWKSRRLLFDLQGQLEDPLSIDPKLNISLKLLHFPLQLAQKFIDDPPLSLRTLYGTASGELIVRGSLTKPEGRGEFSIDRVSTKVDFGSKIPTQLTLGRAQLELDLLSDRISAKGHLGQHIWLDGEYLIKRPELSVGLDLYSLGLSMLYAPTNGERSYRGELKDIIKDFEESANAPFALAPLSLSDPNLSLQVIGLGDDLYCDWTERRLPLGQLIRFGVQGRAQLTWLLEKDQSPKIDLDLDSTRVDYWLRDVGGEVIRHEATDRCLDRCRLRQNHQDLKDKVSNTISSDLPRSAQCPSLSLNTPSAYHIEISGKESFGDTVWVNPQKRWSYSGLKTTQLQKASQKGHCSALSFIGSRPQELVTLMPIILESEGQRLELRFGLTNGQTVGCLTGLMRLNILTPFLRDIYQQVDGSLSLQTSFSGPLSSIQLGGEAQLSSLDLLSPRVKLLGDIHLVEPVWFKLNRLPQGGTEVTLRDKNNLSVTRNAGDININDLSVQLPRFSLQELTVEFNAPQVDIKLPQMLRASLKFDEMRFNMSLPNQVSLSEESDQKSLTEDQPREYTSQARLDLSGDVKVIRAVYHADFLSIDKTFYQGGLNMLSGQTAVETLSVFERTPILKRLFLDLRIEGDNDILVKSKIADLTKLDLELNFDLKMRGKLISERGDLVQDRLTLSGYVDALEGSTLSISNNPFEISHAKVLFGGEIGEDSQTSDFLFADLVASHTYRIPPTGTSNRQINFDQTLSTDLIDEEVMLTGQLKMPTQESPFQVDFDLTSQSGRSRIEILNLILFGNYPSGLSVLDNTQPATGLLLSPVLNFIEKPIADSLGLDNLSLTPDSSSLFIDVDKVFSRRLRFNLRTQIGEVDPNTPQSLFLEYKINNLFAGEITAEQRGDIATGSGRLRLRLSWD